MSIRQENIKTMAEPDNNSEPEWEVQIIRSQNRRKTVSGRLVDNQLVIRAPSHMTDEELKPFIENMKKKIERKNIPDTDESLEKKAKELNDVYFNGRLSWESIRYVTNQNSRFGSCTPSNGTIRLSHKLAKMPRWVRDYVLIHELAHLEEANHGPRFWKLVNQYPLTERARGYLMAVGLEDLTIE